MMVIRAQNSGDRGIPAASGNNFNIFPADRCTWRQVDTTEFSGGYSITAARFIGLGGDTANTALTLSNPELGFIGKSGRFVAISN